MGNFLGSKYKGCMKKKLYALRLAHFSLGHSAPCSSTNEMPLFKPHNSPLDGPVWRVLAELWRGHHGDSTT